MTDTNFSTFLGLALLGLLGLLVTYLVGRSQQAAAPAVAAYLIQVVMGVGFFIAVGLVADDRLYHEEAMNLADAFRTGEPVNSQIGITKASFSWLVGGLYFFFGSHPLIGILFNAALMGLIPSIIGSSCRFFGLANSARTAAWLSALMPQFVFWAPWLRREALAFFLLALVVLAMSLIYGRHYVGGLFLVFTAVAALAITRAQLVAVALTGATAALVASRKKLSGTFVLGGLLVLVTLVMLMPRLAPDAVVNSIAQASDTSQLPNILAETAAVTQNLRVEGVSAEFNTSVSGFGVNLTRTLVGPFPWEWKNLAWIITGVDGMFFLLLLAFSIWVYRICPNQRKQIVVLLVALIPLVVGTTLVLGNYGILMRIRAHFLPFLIPIIGIGLQHLWQLQTRSRYRLRTISAPRQASRPLVRHQG